MSRKHEHASLLEYTIDLQSDLAAWGKQELGDLEAVMQRSGYNWMNEYLEGILENNASGSRLPVTELMKTPSRTHTTKKTRTITTAAKDRTTKVTLANAKLFGSPVQKSTSQSRPPLSPLGSRHLNSILSPNRELSPAKSPAGKSVVPVPAAKADKGKGKAVAKKARTKKHPDVENAIPETESSGSTRSAVSVPTSTSARDEGLLGIQVAVPSRQATPTPPRPPRSPERAAPIALPTFALIPATQEVVEDVAMMETEAVEEEPAEEEEEMQEVEKEDTPSLSTAPTRTRAVDLSIIAEAEEDRTSITIPVPELSAPIQQNTTSNAPLTTISQPLPITEALPTGSESAPSTSIPAPVAVPAPIPPKQVRSSWLSKALGAAPAGPSGTQRPSDGLTRGSIVPPSLRLSTADYPAMRKSLVQPGVLAKRKSGEGIWDEEEPMERPEKMARVETENAIVGPSENHKAVTNPIPPILAPAINASTSKPVLDRQRSQESFFRPTPQSFATLPTEKTPHEKPTSDINRVNKALDGMRERQQAKDIAKQNGTFVSTAGPVSATARSTGTGTGFLRGLGGLGSSLTRSLGLGTGYWNDEEELGQAQLEKDEQEEARRKAKEDLSEVLRKVDEIDQEEVEEDEEMEEELPATIVVETQESTERDEEEDELDELNTDEEDEVNESIEVDEITSLPESPKPAPIHQLPTASNPTRSTTPHRPTRHGVQSTTPQGTPPRSRPATTIVDSQRQLRSSPAQPLPPRAPRQLDGSIAPTATLQDRIKLFNSGSATSTAPQATRSTLFSPKRTGYKQSDAIKVDFDDAPAHPSKSGKNKRPISPDTPGQDGDNEIEMEDGPTSRATSSASLAQSFYGQATTVANKALGMRPAAAQPKSISLASSAYKKDLAASERRAQTKDQRIKIAAEKKAEEERKQKQQEIEERRAKQLDLERRRKEAEERKVAILKVKAERERKDKEAADKAEAEAEAARKQKLASSQNRPAPMQPAKRVISASASSTNLLNGIAKMKEPAKLTKPSGPIPSTHGPSKLVPSTFRTAAPIPPETPIHQMSNTTSIRLVGQPQTQNQGQGERKPLGPPTRASAIRASNQAAAIRQSQAVASQHHPSSSTSGTHTAVLNQSRLALQNQLDAEAAELASEEIVLPDIASEYSDSGDETDDSPAFKRPGWAESPALRAALAAQASKNPDELFGPIRPLSMDELFKAQHKGKFRSRTSSGNWQRDGLKKEEEEEYARRMGFDTGGGKW